MIATIDRRYSDMDIIIRELEQIEAWEKNAVGSLLDPLALASTARLQQKVAEDLQRKAQAEAIRKDELELLDAVGISVTAMLAQLMEAQKTGTRRGRGSPCECVDERTTPSATTEAGYWQRHPS